jgi:hypothetical protein
MPFRNVTTLRGRPHLLVNRLHASSVLLSSWPTSLLSFRERERSDRRLPAPGPFPVGTASGTAQLIPAGVRGPARDG